MNNSQELTQQIKSDTADILRILDASLASLEIEHDHHPPVTEARRLLSDAIVKAETNEKVFWFFDHHNKVHRAEDTNEQ